MSKTNKHIVIIGAGPGGLTAGMLLSSFGFTVTIYEKDAHVGGRNQPITLQDYTFDTGPTFLNLPFLLKELFSLANRNVHQYLNITLLDPLYRLAFTDKTIYPTTDRDRMREQIQQNFPGNEKGLDLFFREEEKRFRALFPCLQKDYSSPTAFTSPQLLKTLP